MAMDPLAKLTMMANQIAQFFRSYPHDEAVAGVAHHIDKFWTPKMRETFRTGLLDTEDGVDPLVLEAVRTDTDGLARDPLAKVAAGTGENGGIVADSG